MTKTRVYLIISGRVQGVFFRYAMYQIASNCYVVGWVKNRADGKVEAVLEGNKENVEKLIEWSYHGPSGASVENVEVAREEYTGEFKEFSIKYF